jgi:hypothetical protein
MIRATGPDGKPAGEDASFKIKSRRVAREINVSTKSGGKAKKSYMKSRSYSGPKSMPIRQELKEAELVKKAMELVEDPAKYEGPQATGQPNT